MAKKIAVAVHKGGVGKTATAVNLAYCLAQKGFEVLLIDCDPSADATKALAGGRNDFDNTIADLFVRGKTKVNVFDLIVSAVDGVDGDNINNLHLLPSGAVLGDAIEAAHGRSLREFILSKALSGVDELFDYIIFDCPPAKDLTFKNAAMMADLIISPVDNGFAVTGLAHLYASIDELREGDMPILRTFKNRYDRRNKNINNDLNRELADATGVVCFNQTINSYVKIAEALTTHYRSVVSRNKGHVASSQYKSLTNEIIEVLPA